MIRSYWVGVAIFTLGELLIRAGGGVLSPLQRTRLRRVVLVTSVALPVLAWLFPIPVSIPGSFASNAMEIPVDPLAADVAAPSVGGSPSDHGALEAAFELPWWLMAQWVVLLGAVVAFARLVASVVSLRRFVSGCAAWNLDDADNVRVHDACSVPFSTVVSGRAVVVLPTWMKDDLRHARLAVAHELQHIRHRDPHWAVIFALVGAALWWHPLRASWRRRAELDQELACDDEVLRSGVGRGRYWATLLEVAARVVAAGRIPGPALGMLGGATESTSSLERRIKAMQQPAKKCARISYLALGAAIVAAQAWIACGAVEQRATSRQSQVFEIGELPAQQLALDSLQRSIQTTGARSGRVIVSHTQTGQILAATGLDEAGIEIAPERVLAEPVRPWSLAKPVLVTLALEHGVTTPTSTHDTAAGARTRDGDEIRDYRPMGTLTTADVIAKSSNIGAMQIGRLLGRSRALEGLSRFHLDGLGGTDTEDVADIAIGRGQVGPLSLLRFYEALGNGGELIVEPARSCGGVPTVERVISAETSEMMREILYGVVRHGTGRLAASDYQPVGGKTATGPRSASFIGVMPRVAVFVLLEDGEGIYGGKDAAPVARSIMEAVQTEGILPGC